MSGADEAYYQLRIEEEVERAQRSSDPKVVRFHYLLTELYLERLYGPAAERCSA